MLLSPGYAEQTNAAVVHGAYFMSLESFVHKEGNRAST